MNKTKSLLLTLMVCAFGFQFAYAQATCTAPQFPTSVTIDLTNQESWDLEDDADNTTITMCDPSLANQQLTHLEWDNVVINTVGASWCSEVVMAINIAIGDPVNGVYLTVGVGDGAPGTPCATYSSGGPVDLASIPIPVFADAGGCVILQIFESFDDVSNAVDATIASGTVTMSGCGNPMVPTLGEWGLIVLGLFIMIAGVVYIRTSRQSELQTVKA